MRTFGFSADAFAVPGCVRCPRNNLLAFRATTTSSLDGYVIPGSYKEQHRNETLYVPMPSMWIIATNGHVLLPAGSISLGWPDGWAPHMQELVRMVPTIGEGHDFNIASNHGYDAGERPQQDVGGAHPFWWVITQRAWFKEASSGSNTLLPGTSQLGMATIIHHARQAAGSVPNRQTLLEWWLEVRDLPEGIELYNIRALEYAHHP